MKRLLVIASLVAITAVGTVISAYAYSNKKHHATCTGSRYCNACKNCKYCKHCAKNGGSCGVCK